MKRRNILALLLTLALTLQLFLTGGCADSGKLTFTDCNGTPLPADQAAYRKLAEEDAAEIIAEIEGISLQKAKKQLNRKGYIVQTAFDPTVYAALEEAYQSDENAPAELGCAVTDMSGQVLALFSASKTDKNNATAGTRPYGTLTPLSVYAPAIENGKANYSTVYLDAPLLKVDDQNWPANPNGSYTYKKTSLANGVSQGLPTVAVRCLKETETDTSIAFLEKLGISFEPSGKDQDTLLKALTAGDDGTSISPVEMAGYYTLFGNVGRYAAPSTVSQITHKDGTYLYERGAAEEQLQNSTAYIVAQMMTGATAEGGIAEKAALEKTAVAGTAASGAEGHWFVGLTPEYSCAVWHSAETTENQAPAFFNKALSKLTHHDADFPGIIATRKAVFCKETGLLYGKNCTKMQMGYYTNDTLPATCESHK